MKDYVQYHNTERMGSPAAVDTLRILTNKPVDRLKGDRVWLVSGEGDPRRYYLCSVFNVEQTDNAQEPGFKFLAKGPGTPFHPPRRLDHLIWFKDFLASQQNFSLGLREIEQRFVAELEAAASDGQTAPSQPGAEDRADPSREVEEDLLATRRAEERMLRAGSLAELAKEFPPPQRWYDEEDLPF